MALGGVEIGSDMAQLADTATPMRMVEVPPMELSLSPMPAHTTVRIGMSRAAVAVFGGKADAVISFVIDMIMGIPHILLLLLISYALGKGVKGVVVGVALSHWPSLARVIRAEVLQLKNSTYIQVAEKLGHSKIKTALKHMTPHIFPQFLVGLILMFPHAILHEAGITFLGFGLPAEQPAIGIILSESMKYLITGKWWLAVFPGAMLVFTVILFDVAGSMLRKMLDPSSVHE